MNLKTLKLNYIQSKQTLAFINLNTNLEELFLTNLSISSKLIDSLKNFKHLKTVILKKIEFILSDEDDNILSILKNDSITYFSLNSNQIKIKEGTLSKALNENYTLETLHIST